MNKKVIYKIIIILSLLFIIFLISHNNLVFENVNFSISVWKDSLFPTLFPFLVVSNILISLNFTKIIGNILKKPMRYIFNIQQESSFILITSLFSGFPSGAKLTTNLVKNKILSKEDAEVLLTFTHYSNPIFILGFIGNLLPDRKITYIILISHILGGLLVGIIFRKKGNKELNKKEIKKEDNNLPIGKIFSDSIIDSLNTLFLLLGVVTIFTLITAFIQTSIKLPILETTLLSCFLEITQGIKNIITLNINIMLKAILITAAISFGGLSVHIQVLSIISEENIKYKSFFLARILHLIISCFITYILINLYMI